MFKKLNKHTNKTIKCKLKPILHNDLDYTFLDDCIRRSNDIIFNCSYFIRNFILHEYKNDNELPILNKDFISMVFNTIIKKSRGPKSKQNTQLLNKLEKFANDHYFKMFYPNGFDLEKVKFDATNLSYILRCAADDMRISYLNNIRLNFFKYVCQFVNQSFKKEHNELIEKCTKNKTELRKQLKKDLRLIKDDLINNTLISDSKYHIWINKYKHKVLPKEFNKSYETDIKHYPFKYVKHMLFMNDFLEKNGYKTFQPISLRTDIKDKYITINTNALIDILPNLKNKNKYFTDIRKYQDDIWNMFFNIKGSKFKLNKFSFNHQIQTDGFAVSINFINNNEIQKKQKKTDKMLNASKKGKQINKNKTREEILNSKLKKENSVISEKIKLDEKYKIIRKENKEKFKKLPKDEQEKIKLQIKIDKNEFNYIQDLIKCTKFLQFIKQAHKDKRLVYSDPGKRKPLYTLGDNGKTFNYRTRRRLKETKRLKYNKLIDNKKYKTKLVKMGITIKESETQLSNFSKNTVDIEKFKNFTLLKMKIKSDTVNENNYNNYLQKLKWFSYINTKRHEDNLINDYKKIYGKDAVFIIGDWVRNKKNL